MSSAWNHVHGFERLSLCDWPGYSSCVLFLGGCNMRCPTCHNWRLAWHADTLPALSRAAVESYLEARRHWLDGVVVTGGEATMVEGFADMLRDLRRFGLPVKVDSNGLRPEVVAVLLRDGLVDAFSIDVKGPFALYPRLSGGTTTPDEARAALSRIFALATARPAAFLFRLTRVPVLSDDDVEAARRQLPAGFDLKIQEYVPPRRKHAEAYPEARRAAGDVVHGPHRGSHPEGTESKRH